MEVARDQSWSLASRTIKKVLVVDDSVAHQRLARTILEKWGYSVSVADDGASALDILEAEEIDLVLSDWVMPGMSGLELCRAFRGRLAKRYVYFILLTSKSSRTDVAEGLDAGADDFLSKPINAEELRGRISAGERLVSSQRMLEWKNSALADALGTLQHLYDDIAKDLSEARKLQLALVPHKTIDYDDIRLSFELRPCGHVGGDLVGGFALREGAVCAYSIDVSGHGVASALMTARLASYLSANDRTRNIAIHKPPDGDWTLRSPDEVCHDLNQMILADMDTELYCTMAIAMIDPVTGKGSMAQAGHPHPFILRRGGTCEAIGSGGLPIGLLDKATFAVTPFEMSPGDKLLLYSDGLTEQVNKANDMLEEAGLQRAMSEARDAKSTAFLDALVRVVEDHAAGEALGDDISAVLLEYNRGSEEA